MVPVNKPLEIQLEFVKEVIVKNPCINEILNSDPFPNNSNWYLGAGCINQTIWNYITNREITYGIGDYDLVYYDASDISKKTETRQQKRIKEKYKSLSIKIDVINEARVHLWFEEDFGKKIDQYKSVEEAINSWPTTATAFGVRKVNEKIEVYAPYGLNDLLNMIIRPNKEHVIKEIYKEKCQKWKSKWPKLEVVKW